MPSAIRAKMIARPVRASTSHKKVDFEQLVAARRLAIRQLPLGGRPNRRAHLWMLGRHGRCTQASPVCSTQPPQSAHGIGAYRRSGGETCGGQVTAGTTGGKPLDARAWRCRGIAARRALRASTLGYLSHVRRMRLAQLSHKRSHKPTLKALQIAIA